MTGPNPSLVARVVQACFAILAASVALHLAADFLRDALPVLIPVSAGVFLAVVAGRWWWHRTRNW